MRLAVVVARLARTVSLAAEAALALKHRRAVRGKREVEGEVAPGDLGAVAIALEE